MASTIATFRNSVERLGADAPAFIPRVIVKSRAKRCFELAGMGIDLDQAADWHLVHGERDSSGQRYLHGWLQSKDGIVYDPVEDEVFQWADYAERFDAVPVYSFNQRQARTMISSFGNWGCWFNRFRGVLRWHPKSNQYVTVEGGDWSRVSLRRESVSASYRRRGHRFVAMTFTP